MHEFWIVGGGALFCFRGAEIDPCASLRFGSESVWTHFNNLSQDKFPTPGELFKMAVSLHDNYSSPRASTIFMLGDQLDSSIMPTGEPWWEEEDLEQKPAPVGADSMGNGRAEGGDRSGGKGEGGSEKQEDVVPAEREEFNGDHTLMRSALFMHEALVSKEVAQAVAEGDPRRVYEGIKVCCQLGPNLSVLTKRSSCCLHSRAPRTTSTPATCLT